MSKTFLETCLELDEKNEAYIIVTLVKTRGSAPQEVGAKIFVGTEGHIAGTIGGGKVEEKVIEYSKKMLFGSESFNYVEWNLQTDVKMTCGGVVDFIFEKVDKRPDWKIAIFGAGHVAQELVRVLLRLNCFITCIDPRLEWLNKLPEDRKLLKIPKNEMSEIVSSLDPNTFIASMTMGHSFDLPILNEALKRNVFPYIGVIGSSSKAVVLKNDLLKSGCSELMLQKLYCPIGESFGNNSPSEIAISIASQLIISRDKLSK